ncbi:hypothetical protein ACO0QE_002618 [Hanseniaspora vineae]
MLTYEEEANDYKNGVTNEKKIVKESIDKPEVEESISEQSFSELSQNLSYINKLKLNDFDLSKGSGDIYMNATSDFNDSNDHSTLLGNNNINGSISTPKLLDFEESGESCGRFEAHMNNDQIILSENDSLDELHFVNSIPDAVLSNAVLPVLTSNHENNKRRLHNVSRTDLVNTSDDYTKDIFDKKVRERRYIFESGAREDFVGKTQKQSPDNSYETALENLQEETCEKILAGLERLTDLSNNMSTKAKIEMFENASQQATGSLQKTAKVKDLAIKKTLNMKKLDQQKEVESVTGDIDTTPSLHTFKEEEEEEEEEDIQEDDSYSNSSIELIRQLQMSTKVKDKRMLFETLVEKTNELSLGNSNYRKHSKRKRVTENVLSNNASIQQINDKKNAGLGTLAQNLLADASSNSIAIVEQQMEDLSLADHDSLTEAVKLDSKALSQPSNYDAQSNTDSFVITSANEIKNETE